MNKKHIRQFVQDTASSASDLDYEAEWCWVYRNNHGFTFALDLGLEFSIFSTLIQPGLEIVHKELSAFYVKIREASGGQSGKLYTGAPKFLFDTVGFTRKTPAKHFSTTAELIDHAKLYFKEFNQEKLQYLHRIDGPKKLLDYMRVQNFLYGPKGLATEMILERFNLNKEQFDRKYRGKGAVMHKRYFSSILESY